VISLRALDLGIVAIANQKGGVGKTVTAINLASGLVKAGQRVLVVDGDPQANLSLFFGADEKRKPGSGDLARLLTALAAGEKPRLKDHLIKQARRGLDLLPAGSRDLRLALGDTAIARAAPGFADLLRAARAEYRWILIDSSPSNGALERLLLAASEAVIVPLEFQLFSVSGLEALIEDVAGCAAAVGRDIRVHAIIFTKAENKVARIDSYRELFAAFRIPIFEICRSEYVPRSLERSRTLFECAPSSFAARDYGRVIQRAFLE
jgi:chromosome partitioning protein